MLSRTVGDRVTKDAYDHRICRSHDIDGGQKEPRSCRVFVHKPVGILRVIASARSFSNAAKASGQSTALEPGYYRVHRHMNAALAFALLLKPSARVQTKITIPEGRRLSQIIATLGRDTGNLQGYRQAIKDVVGDNEIPKEVDRQALESTVKDVVKEAVKQAVRDVVEEAAAEQVESEPEKVEA